MTPEEWAHQHVIPPSFTACGHHDHRLRDGVSVCRTCGHMWTEHTIILDDDVYDTLLAYMAFRLDNK